MIFGFFFLSFLENGFFRPFRFDCNRCYHNDSTRVFSLCSPFLVCVCLCQGIHKKVINFNNSDNDDSNAMTEKGTRNFKLN